MLIISALHFTVGNDMTVQMQSWKQLVVGTIFCQQIWFLNKQPMVYYTQNQRGYF